MLKHRALLGCLCAGLALFISASAEETGILREHIPVEAGFDGAVTIVDEGRVDDCVYATVSVPYRDVHGESKMGQARVMILEDELDAILPLPAFHNVHYELGLDGAKNWAQRGWVVFTPHYGTPEDGGYPLELCTGDSYNLAKAIIQWGRRLPFVDHNILHLNGGSAGGYMALAMAAEMFPVTSVTADSPVCNWSYNLNYFEVNKPASKYPVADMAQSPLPILVSVTMLTDWSYGVFGKDLADDKWFVLSPVSYLERITCPALVTCATGDMLVPLEQMTKRQNYVLEPGVFPEDYQRDFLELTPNEASKKRFDEMIPERKIEYLVMPRQKDSYEITLEHFKGNDVPKGPENEDRPWSREKQWSLLILDEGPPAPHSSHVRMKWATSPDSFVETHKGTSIPFTMLSQPKLTRLLQRYAGEIAPVATLADGTKANRGNFDALEKLDVLNALIEYTDLGMPYAMRLESMYKASPIKPFGETWALERLLDERASLLETLAIDTQTVGDQAKCLHCS